MSGAILANKKEGKDERFVKMEMSMRVQLYDGNRFVDITGVTFLRSREKSVHRAKLLPVSPRQQSLTIVTGSNDTNIHTCVFTGAEHSQ